MEIPIEHNHSNDTNSGKAKTIKLSLLGYTVKLFVKWFGFTSFYAVFSVCPFCGQSGCTIGFGSASILGAFFALVFNDWKILFFYFRQKF